MTGLLMAIFFGGGFFYGVIVTALFYRQKLRDAQEMLELSQEARWRETLRYRSTLD